jgi:hypothetical protein
VEKERTFEYKRLLSSIEAEGLVRDGGKLAMAAVKRECTERILELKYNLMAKLKGPVSVVYARKKDGVHEMVVSGDKVAIDFFPMQHTLSEERGIISLTFRKRFVMLEPD